MSHRWLFLKHGHLAESAPLLNGLGRFIPQLQRVTLKFCKESPPSYGVRQFIENDIVAFAEQNPHVAIYLKPRRHRSPVIVAEYLNGVRHWQSLFNYQREHVIGWLDVYRTASGKEFQWQQKKHYTDVLSIQGMWHSNVNTDPRVALAKFPDESLAGPMKREQTASEQLMHLYEFQQELIRQQQNAAVDGGHSNLPPNEQVQLNREKQSDGVR